MERMRRVSEFCGERTATRRERNLTLNSRFSLSAPPTFSPEVLWSTRGPADAVGSGNVPEETNAKLQ